MKNKIILITTIFILLLPAVFAGSVTRSFSDSTVNQGGMVTTSLDVVVDGASVYTIVEYVPPGWTVTDHGTGTLQPSGDEIRWIQIGSAVDTILQYTVQAPSVNGVYSFDGTYQFDVDPIETTLGETEVTVTSTSSPPEIKINEFESNPSSGNEWVELYNPNTASVDISGWKLYDGLASPSLIYTIPASTNIAGKGYYIAELSSAKLNNGDEFVTLKDSADTQIDETPTKADGYGDDRTWQRVPDGADNWEFVTETKGATNDGEEPPEPPTECQDDLMVNYLRGKITIDNNAAPAGIEYLVTVISGLNAGANYSGEVDDSKVPSFLYENGYFDTGDNICFSTGDQYRITVPGYDGEITGVFSNGGDGDFNDELSLVSGNFDSIPNDPVISLVYDATAYEDSLHSITINVDDPDLGDSWTYYKDGEVLVSDTTSKSYLFTWTPTQEEVGDIDFLFRVVDSTAREDSETAHITVENVDDAAEWETLEDQSIDEDSSDGTIVYEDLKDKCSDIDNGITMTVTSTHSHFDLAFSGDDLVINNLEEDYTGEETIELDCNGIANSFDLTIIETDDPAEWQSLDDKEVGEDSSDGTIVYEDLKLLCTDPDSEINMSVKSMPVHYWLELSGDDLVISSMELNYYDTGEIVIVDCNGILAEFTLTVTPTNDAPFITGYYPDHNPIIPEDGSQEFGVSYDDIDVGDMHDLTWTVDGDEKGHGDNFIYNGSNFVGIYSKEVIIEVSDSTDSVHHEWILTETSCPLTTKFTTTPPDLCSLTEWELASVFPFILENEYGRIEWLEPVDLRDVVDIDGNVRIELGLAGVNTTEYPQLDKNAEITLWQLSYTEDPSVMYNEDYEEQPLDACEICDISSFTEPPTTDGEVIFEVEHLSLFVVIANQAPEIVSSAIESAYLDEEYNYQVIANDPDDDVLIYSLVESPDGMTISSSGLISWIPNATNDYDVEVMVDDGFGGTDTQFYTITVTEAPKLRIVNVEVDVDGDEDDNVKNGEKISKEAKPLSDVEFKVEVENFYLEDIEIEDVELTVTIEDIDDGDELEEEDEIGDIKAGKDKSGKVTFKIPLKVDEDTYDVKIVVEGEDENNIEHRDEWIVQLEVEKDKHDLVLRNIDLSPIIIKCQQSANLAFTVTNIGGKDEDDVKVTISNSDLNLNKVFDNIELEEGTDDDSDFSDSYFIRLPEDLEDGTYSIDIKAYYDGTKADSETVELVKEECLVKPKVTKKAEEKVVVEKKEAPVEIPMYYKPQTCDKPTCGAPTEITFIESSTYIFLIAVLIIILAGATLFAFGALISMAKKR